MRILARLKNPLAFAASILVILLVVTQSAKTPPANIATKSLSFLDASLAPARKISNPAAVYCKDMGYAYNVTSDGAGGQTDTCTMPDGQTCSAWDFLEGKCGQAYSFCARQGRGVRTASDGKNPFSPEYAVCVDAQGQDAGMLTTLDTLGSKLNRCGLNSPPAVSPVKPGSPLKLPVPITLPKASLSGTPPASWDWRNATINKISGDWTSPVKDQGSCGSCWAFAAVGQTEAVLNIAKSNPNLDKDLAEEYLVSDCSSAGSCCGGWHSNALDFIQNSGIPDEACLPYVSGTCGCFDTGTCSCTYSDSSSKICANSTCSQRCGDYGSRLSYIDSYDSVATDARFRCPGPSGIETNHKMR